MCVYVCVSIKLEGDLIYQCWAEMKAIKFRTVLCNMKQFLQQIIKVHITTKIWLINVTPHASLFYFFFYFTFFPQVKAKGSNQVYKPLKCGSKKNKENGKLNTTDEVTALVTWRRVVWKSRFHHHYTHLGCYMGFIFVNTLTGKGVRQHCGEAQQPLKASGFLEKKVLAKEKKGKKHSEELMQESAKHWILKIYDYIQ